MARRHQFAPESPANRPDTPISGMSHRLQPIPSPSPPPPPPPAAPIVGRRCIVLSWCRSPSRRRCVLSSLLAAARGGQQPPPPPPPATHLDPRHFVRLPFNWSGSQRHFRFYRLGGRGRGRRRGQPRSHGAGTAPTATQGHTGSVRVTPCQTR